jgi:hypothetical protein
MFTPTLDNTADNFTKKEIFLKHAAKLEQTLPNGSERCNITIFPIQDSIFESQQNEWIKVMHRNKIKSQGREKSPPSNALVCAIFD